MTPLFDLGAIARRPDDEPAEAANTRPRATKAPVRGTATASKPIDFWVRGVFRSGDGERTRTVEAVGMSGRLDADVAKFIEYLTVEGWQFPAGRALLVEILGVGADDGMQISLNRAQGGTSP